MRKISNSYTMGCLPVRGDNPRALVSGLSYVQVDKHSINIYTTYISVDLAHNEIYHAKVGKGGIDMQISLRFHFYLVFFCSANICLTTCFMLTIKTLFSLCICVPCGVDTFFLSY